MSASIFNADSQSAGDSVALAEREGAFARATGQAGCLNPYLEVAGNRRDLSDAQHAEWSHCCSAWWKGWDDEQGRRQPYHLDRHSPGAVILPWLLGVPVVEQTASIAERSAARSGLDLETTV